MSGNNYKHLLLPLKKQCLSLSPSSSINNHTNQTTHESESNVGWKTVSKGIKNHKSGATNFLNTSPKKKLEVLAQNKYFVPSKLEKSLHHNSGIAAHFSPKPQRDDNDKGCKTTLRCHMRNQRRRRKRAQLRLAREIKSNEEAGNPEKEGKAIAISKTVVEVSKPKPTVLEVKDIWTSAILPFLALKDIVTFGCCSKECKILSEAGHLWKSFYRSKFPSLVLDPVSLKEWKLAYKLSTNRVLDRLRCFHTKKTFFEDVVGIGVDFTVNPVTNRVDYISTSQDLFSATAFNDLKIKTDVFGNKFKLFLPLYFSAGHFRRALPLIKKVVVRLCPELKTSMFCPSMVLDVFPKIINTFVVLVSDEGLAASRRSFHGIMRIHRLFLAIAHEYPIIRSEALCKLKNFAYLEEHRLKSSCPSLGNLIPLLMIVDQNVFQWANISKAYLSESRDRSVLWICKAHPKLENLNGSCSDDERLRLTLEAAKVSMRLNMLNVYFLWIFCKGSTLDRAFLYDQFCESLETEENILGKTKPAAQVGNDGDSALVPAKSRPHLSFQKFRYQIHRILSVKHWQQYYNYLLVPCPPSKAGMAQLLRDAVKNSLRKKYHKKGMNFSKIHSSGTSTILAKGQQYSASDSLQRVVFQDVWTFDTNMFLDATCLLYAGKKRVSTVDYSHTSFGSGAVIHSGDVMTDTDGTHTINLDLTALDEKITACVFVLSAWAGATLFDVRTASVSFRDADADLEASPLCTYHLDSHDKVSHLKSIIMCKLYRTDSSKGWHVLSIGDSHEGAADNYGPIYEAVQKLV